MRQSLARCSATVSFVHPPSLADFITTIVGFEVFGTHSCSFINVLLESDIESPVRRAAAIHLGKIRAFIHGLAKEAHLRDPEKFAQAWHMLMKGSIVSAGEGNKNAARDAKRAARLILDGWSRKSQLLPAL